MLHLEMLDGAPGFASLADPAGANALVSAVQWLEGTLLGTIAVTVAVVAVAFAGVMMLTGRLNLRHGATVILGCFLLFGAPGIAAGIRAAAGGGDHGPASRDDAAAPGEPLPSPIVIPPPRADRPAAYDPYAGAAVPSR